MIGAGTLAALGPAAPQPPQPSAVHLADIVASVDATWTAGGLRLEVWARPGAVHAPTPVELDDAARALGARTVVLRDLPPCA